MLKKLIAEVVSKKWKKYRKARKIFVYVIFPAISSFWMMFVGITWINKTPSCEKNCDPVALIPLVLLIVGFLLALYAGKGLIDATNDYDY